MPKITDTYTRAFNCCGTIFMEMGRFPTIDLIRERIGVNSPTTIKRAMNDWTLAFAEQHFNKTNRPNIPEALINSMEQAWKVAVVEAEKTYLVKERGHLEKINEMNKELDELKNENKFLTLNLNNASSLVNEYEKKISTQKTDNDRQRIKLEQMENSLDLTQKELLYQSDLLKQQNERWEYQQRKEQEWFTSRIIEERISEENKWKGKIQQLYDRITVLTSTETNLQSLCVTYRKEQKRLMKELSDLKSASNNLKLFKIKSRRQ